MLSAGGGTERFAALNAALTTGPLLLSTAAGQQSDDVLQLTLVTHGHRTRRLRAPASPCAWRRAAAHAC